MKKNIVNTNENKTIVNLNEKNKEVRKSWNIVEALDFIVNNAKDSKLNQEFWENCAEPLDYLEKNLQLTKVQIVFLSIMIEEGEPISWRGFGQFLNCSRLSVMTYSEEIEQLVYKGWIKRSGVRELGRNFQGFGLEYGVVTALRRNETFIPKKISGLDIQEFCDFLEYHIGQFCNNFEKDLYTEEEWLQNLCKVNNHLQICNELLKYNDIHVLSLMLFIVYDYAQWAGSEGEGLTYGDIDNFYPNDFKVDFLRKKLNNGTHPLILSGLIEPKCEDGIANHNRFMITRKGKEDLLAGFVPSQSRCPSSSNMKRYLKSHKDIKEKTMFYNTEEQEQIQHLSEHLSQDNLPSVQQRLEEAGLRKGFACFFYGAPGTGKTESVLQIVRMTGRDIMQVDIAGMRDKYVGESEKNIKAVFQRYRDACEQSEVMPILLFNEADALINKRTENIDHSVDKMNNAMQNIILQEIEDLDGILIATTNLTSNLDNAFERRFLFKIEFHNPTNEVKAKLWHNMLSNLTDEEVNHLAKAYDFSGGQIENIARKYTIEYILSGKHASLETIEGYCKSETLYSKTRTRIGF